MSQTTLNPISAKLCAPKSHLFRMPKSHTAQAFPSTISSSSSDAISHSSYICGIPSPRREYLTSRTSCMECSRRRRIQSSFQRRCEHLPTITPSTTSSSQRRTSVFADGTWFRQMWPNSRA
ncbi:hypothetical protein GSI_02225 [Ganoderma sinense ZZ0214-1]|uniref:Uncharacterized protein n=1 Tax=Ganoderma sinense ZZ0214-1 TaxID=1077348 RepID=A0A2G8SNZ5_9APHY|nr:hypothetical protein GSI_02225 [Ganoderma sinense ZZ0214-1]